jgi:outer membrane protein OmpA-like peptidoglycan-associated protein
MTRLAVASVVLVLTVTHACRPRPAVQPTVPSPPPIQDVVALLPDPETKAIGHALVSSPVGGSVELTNDRPATHVAIGEPPKPPVTISEAEVQKLFGDALAARPPAPRQFLLYFVTGSSRLTRESETLLTNILASVTNRPAPDVTVIGHTDTVGAARANIQLGMSRATLIRERLITVGLDYRLISVVSHGEADLLVPTPDETDEARNRRVEVSVR